jgi:tetratricopeptide (TPR) repeat protein
VLAGVGCLVLSLAAGRRYASDERLFAPEVAREPACREAHFYLGESARARRELERAAFHYEHASRVTPGMLAYVDEQATLQNLGAVYFASGRRADAKRAWSAALAVATDARDRREIEHNLAALALEAGDAAEAARLLERQVSGDDALPEALLVRAKALHELGRSPEASALIARFNGVRRPR